MDRNSWVLTLFVLLHLKLYISGQIIPENVTVRIWEGNVTITWDPPMEIPGDFFYQVQLNNYTDSPGVWFNVSHCILLKTTICNIGYLLADSEFRVRVGILMTHNNIFWSSKRHINIQRSQLIAPTFNLSYTSYSVKVKIHRKQILDDLFKYGLQYTTYLWPDGQKKQTLTKSTNDNDCEMTFTSLQSLQVYCVLVKVESTTSQASNISSVHCIKLPLDATLIFCFILLGPLGIITILSVFVCFLRRPRKMPSALKLVVNVWKPMIIKSEHLETVTDKGWIVIANGDTKNIIEFSEQSKERKGSLDSGVSIEQLHLPASNEKTEGQIRDVLVDSGCESLKGTEGSENFGGVTRQFFKHEIHCSGKNEGTEDSGVGLVHQEVSCSLEREDTELLSKVTGPGVTGAGYRSQSPSSVDVQNDMDLNMAAPSVGYRSSHVTCMCSDHEYCIWCKYKNPFTEDCQPVAQSDIRQIDGNSELISASYLKKGCMQTANLLNMEVPMTEPAQFDNACAETSLILLSCPLLLQNEKKQDSTMHARSFILDNVELTFS